MHKQKAVAESISLRIAQYKKTEKPQTPILLYANEIQKSFIYFPPDNISIEQIARPIEQQTLYVISGTAQMEIKEETILLKKGSMVVIPPDQSFSMQKTKNFLAITIVSPGTNHKRVEEVVKKLFPSTEKVRGKKIFRTNLLDLLAEGPRKKFMDTPKGHPDVEEIEVFFPFVDMTHDLTAFQAARILIYENSTVLNRHVHPYAQHAIFIMDGEAVIESEGEQWHLGANSLFIEPPNAKHRLGSNGRMVGFVINTPGIDPTDPNYEIHVEDLNHPPVIKHLH